MLFIYYFNEPSCSPRMWSLISFPFVPVRFSLSCHGQHWGLRSFVISQPSPSASLHGADSVKLIRNIRSVYAHIQRGSSGNDRWHPLTSADSCSVFLSSRALCSTKIFNNKKEWKWLFQRYLSYFYKMKFFLSASLWHHPVMRGAISGENINWIYLLCLDGMVMKDTWPIRRYNYSHLQGSTPLMCREGKQHYSFVKHKPPPLQNVLGDGLVAHPGSVKILKSKLNSCLKCTIYFILVMGLENVKWKCKRVLPTILSELGENSLIIHFTAQIWKARLRACFYSESWWMEPVSRAISPHLRLGPNINLLILMCVEHTYLSRFWAQSSLHGQSSWEGGQNQKERKRNPLGRCLTWVWRLRSPQPSCLQSRGAGKLVSWLRTGLKASDPVKHLVQFLDRAKNWELVGPRVQILKNLEFWCPRQGMLLLKRKQ